MTQVIAGIHSTISEAHIRLYVPPFIKKHHYKVSNAWNGESSEPVSAQFVLLLSLPVRHKDREGVICAGLKILKKG